MDLTIAEGLKISADLGLRTSWKKDHSLKLKIKRNDWMLADKQPIIVLYFDFDNELKFYNLGAWYLH